MAVNVGAITATVELEDKMSKQLTGATKRMNTFQGVTKTAIGTMGGFIGAQAAIAGVGAVVRGVSTAFTSMASSAINMNATLETTTLQFETLMGDSDKARKHVESLFEFAKKTPFETGPIIEASRMMQTFGGDALNTKKNLELLGDASAATGAPIDQLGFWVGRLHSQLQAGKPFGEAAMRLQELAVLSPKARDEMEQLQKAGASASEVYAAFEGDLEKFTGGMERQAATWEGVTSTLKDVIQLTLADALKPLFEFAREGIAQLNKALESPALQKVPEQIAESLRVAFGDDMQGAVAKMAKAIIGWVKVGVHGAKLLGRSFSILKTIFHGNVVIALSVAEVLNMVALSVAHLINMTPGLRGSMNGVIKTLEGWAVGLDEMNDSQMESVVQSGKNVVANTKFNKAMDAGLDILDDLADSFGNATDEASEMADAVSDTTGNVESLTVASKALTKEQKAIVTAWKSGAIPKANDLVAALSKMEGGLDDLTKTALVDFNKTLGTAMQDAHRLNLELDPVIVDLWKQSVDRLTPTVQGLGDSMAHLQQRFPGPMRISVADMPAIGTPMEPAPMLGVGTRFGLTFKKGFEQIVSQLPTTVSDAFKGGGGLFGAFKALGSQLGAAFGGSLGTTIAGSIGENAGKFAKALGSMAGPLGAAIGSLVGPLMSGLKKLFGGRSVARNVEITVKSKWGHALSKGLQEAISATSKTMGSHYAAILSHLGDIFEEAGGVMAFGLSKAIRATRDLFSMVETGKMTTEQASTAFDAAFSQIAEAAISTGEIVGTQFTELITLAQKFGIESAAMMNFVREQSEATAEGLATLFGPTIERADEFQTKIDGLREKLAGLEEGSKAYNRTAEQLANVLAKQADFSNRSKRELEDLGLIAVASFEKALASGMSFTEAVKAHGPAIDALIAAQEKAGITSNNVAIQELSDFRKRVQANSTLVAAVESFDDVMMSLSRTGSLNADTLAAMERQGVRMYNKLIKKGFSQEQALMMMGPSLKKIMEAHEKLGIPISKNTEKLIAQAREAGTLEDDQKSGWEAVAGAVNKVVDKLQEMIDKIGGVDRGLRGMPRTVKTDIYVEEHYSSSGRGGRRRADHWYDEEMAHGGIVTSPTRALIGEAGPEAVIPLSQLTDEGLLDELKGMRSDLRRLPIMLRDALILAS